MLLKYLANLPHLIGFGLATLVWLNIDKEWWLSLCKDMVIALDAFAKAHPSQQVTQVAKINIVIRLTTQDTPQQPIPL